MHEGYLDQYMQAISLVRPGKQPFPTPTSTLSQPTATQISCLSKLNQYASRKFDPIMRVSRLSPSARDPTPCGPKARIKGRDGRSANASHSCPPNDILPGPPIACLRTLMDGGEEPFRKVHMVKLVLRLPRSELWPDTRRVQLLNGTETPGWYTQ